MEELSFPSSGPRRKYSTLPGFLASLTCGRMVFFVGKCLLVERCRMAGLRIQRWWNEYRGGKFSPSHPPAHIKSMSVCDFAGRLFLTTGLHSELLKSNSPMCLRPYRWIDTQNYKNYKTSCLPEGWKLLPAPNVIYMLEIRRTKPQPVIQ